MSDVLNALDAEARAAGLPSATLDRIVLVAGELIANALEHGDRGIQMALDVSSVGARLWATGERLGDAPTLPIAEATSGRGLFLIAALSDGTEALSGATRYTFRVRTDESPLLH